MLSRASRAYICHVWSMWSAVCWRWAAVCAILMFHQLFRAKSRDSVHKPHVFLKRKVRLSGESNRAWVGFRLPALHITTKPSRPRWQLSGWTTLFLCLAFSLRLLSRRDRTVHGWQMVTRTNSGMRQSVDSDKHSRLPSPGDSWDHGGCWRNKWCWTSREGKLKTSRILPFPVNILSRRLVTFILQWESCGIQPDQQAPGCRCIRSMYKGPLVSRFSDTKCCTRWATYTSGNTPHKPLAQAPDLQCITVKTHSVIVSRFMMMIMMTVNDDNDVHLYSAVTPCYCSMLGALGRVVSVEACCHWMGAT